MGWVSNSYLVRSIRVTNAHQLIEFPAIIVQPVHHSFYYTANISYKFDFFLGLLIPASAPIDLLLSLILRQCNKIIENYLSFFVISLRGLW